MEVLGYNHWDLIFASPFLVIALILHAFWRKNVSKDLSYTMYTFATSIPKIIFIWAYTILLAVIYCKKSGKSWGDTFKESFKQSWKPMLPVLIYLTAMIILNMVAKNIPVFTTVFEVLNFIINNFVVFYLVGVVVWRRVLKSTYDECF